MLSRPLWIHKKVIKEACVVLGQYSCMGFRLLRPDPHHIPAMWGRRPECQIHILGPSLGLWISINLTEADRQRIALGKWLNGSLINATQKLLRKKNLATRQSSKENIMEVSSGEVCPSTSGWKEPLVDSQQQTVPSWYYLCLWQHKGCYYKEPGSCCYALQGSGDCAWSQISGSDCGLHAVATAYEAMTQLASHGSMINFAHTFSNQAISKERSET